MARSLSRMSMPLTRATTASDAEEADEDDEDEDEDCCPQPVAIGSTRSASAATVETAVRRGRSSTGAGYVNRGSFNEIMALSLKIILVPPFPKFVIRPQHTPARTSETKGALATLWIWCRYRFEVPSRVCRNC